MKTFWGFPGQKGEPKGEILILGKKKGPEGYRPGQEKTHMAPTPYTYFIYRQARSEAEIK
jgi:hypothetical protein